MLLILLQISGDEMATYEIDTEKVEQAGKDIVDLSKELYNLLGKLDIRFKRMVTETFEWEGNGADKFVSISSGQLKAMQNFANLLKNYGLKLKLQAQRYDTSAKESKIDDETEL